MRGAHYETYQFSTRKVKHPENHQTKRATAEPVLLQNKLLPHVERKTLKRKGKSESVRIFKSLVLVKIQTVKVAHSRRRDGEEDQDRKAEARQGLLVGQGDRLPLEGLLQAGPAQQEVRVPAEVARVPRPVRCAGVVDAGGQGAHARLLPHRRRRPRPHQAHPGLHRAAERHHHRKVPR